MSIILCVCVCAHVRACVRACVCVMSCVRNLIPPQHILDRWFESEPLKAVLATDSVIGAMLSPYMSGSG